MRNYTEAIEAIQLILDAIEQDEGLQRIYSLYMRFQL
jgi:hypothetical protein